MTAGRVVVAARLAFLGLALVATGRLIPVVREIGAWRPEAGGAPRSWSPVDRAELTQAADMAIARLTSSPAHDISATETIGDQPSTAEPSVARVPVPALELRGVIGGPPWRGVVRGLPGTQGDVVVRVGDRFQELVVMRIDARGLLATWQDSTWVVELGSWDR